MNPARIEYEHAYNALNRRKYISLTEKKGMLISLQQYTFLNPEIESYMSLARSSSAKKWNEAFTAARLAEVWVVHRSLPPSRARVNSLRKLQEVMAIVTVAVDKWRTDEDESQSRTTRTSLNYQRLSGRVQDTVQFDPEERDTLPCAVCGHLCVMPVERAEDVNRKNHAILDGYAEKMRRWEALPEATRGGKPRKTATSSTFRYKTP